MKALLVITAYLLGSIPTGFIVVKALKKEDIRKSGSGATGATNVHRKLGPFWAVPVAFGDVMKAYIPTLIAVKLWPNKHWLHLLVGGAANLGHSKSVFLRFRGGKAVSTSAGFFFAIAGREPKLWSVFYFSLGGFLGAIIGSGGIISLGSVFGPIIGSLYSTRLSNLSKVSKWYTFGLWMAAGFITLMHRENLVRLFRGEEPKTGKEILDQLVNTTRKTVGKLFN